MALSNSQYDEIIRGYEQRQLHNRRLTEKRQEEIYKKEPRLRKIDGLIAENSINKAKLLFDGDKP